MYQDVPSNISINGQPIDVYSTEGFKLLSQIWLKAAWDQKHPYTFTWLGRPVIQNPEDLLRIQELIWTLKPDVIIETGVAHGGSLVFYASLLSAFGPGQVIGVDIDIRSHNRLEIESHPLNNRITLIEGSSTAKPTLEKVSSLIRPDQSVLVILDSCHTREHVFSELQSYSPFVTKNSYIVVTDGSQKYLGDSPRALRQYGSYAETWPTNNPLDALNDFLQTNHNFVCEEPSFLFNESHIDFRITHWPRCFLRRHA